MAKTFSFDLDMNKGERSDQIVYGRAGDKQSVNIVANLKLDGATWTPPSGDVNAYFECITGDNKSIRVKATLSDSTVSVSLPTDVYSFFGIVSNAYFRVEVGSADSPTYVESSASFSVYIFGSVDTAYTAFENSADLVNWRKLNATLNEVINQANASVNAAIKAFNEQLSGNKSRIDQAVSGASQVVDEADSLRRGGLTKPLAVSDGGTGADNAAQARANLGISGSAFSGDYNDLTNKPVIPVTPISVANGGTGATTASAARANLGIDSAATYPAFRYTAFRTGSNITAVPLVQGSSGVMEVGAAIDLHKKDSTKDYDVRIGIDDVSGLSIEPTLSVKYGGTGANTVAGARNALGLGNTSGAVPVANGGTGATTAAQARANLGISESGSAQEAASAEKLSTARTIVTNLASTNAASFDGTANVTPGVSGVLGIANGGTGQTTLDGLKTALGVVSITSGTADPPSTGTAGSIYVKLS